jgi:glycosyltransferase involved in cell wall biosynthesis
MRSVARILHVTQPTDGGTANMVKHITSASKRAGHDVTIACPNGPLASWATASGIRWERVGLTRAPGPTDMACIRRVRELARTCHVMHLHSSKAGAVGRIALATLPRPDRPKCIFTPHGWSWYAGGRGQPAYRAWERVASHWADVITSVSPSETAAGRDTLGPAAVGKLRQIDNGVDTLTFTPDGEKAQRGKAPLILCVGRLTEQKGQDRLIQALALVKNTSARVRFLGNGPSSESLRNLARSLGLNERVEFLVDQDPGPHYRACDLVVLPSRWEGMPLVLLEAMACGVATLATEEAAGSLLRHCGVTLPMPFDVNQLAEAIDSLLADDALRANLGRNARARVRSHHSINTVTARYLEIVGELHTPLTSSEVDRPATVSSHVE